MDFFTYIVYTAVFGFLGGVAAYALFGPRAFVSIIPVIAIVTISTIAALIFGSMIVDTVHEQETLNCSTFNLTVIDTFQQPADILHWPDPLDLTVKLSDGKIIHYYNDPFAWKNLKCGSNFTVIKAEYNSYRMGHVSKYYYNPLDAPTSCRMAYPEIPIWRNER